MVASLDTLAEQVRTENVVKRSRFIATVGPVPDVTAADRLITGVRREFFDARHHCTAMILGPDGQQQRSNDDGEPAGTAGAPMLAVLRGARLTDLVAVVTRYFGGTLLGAGGLVRAYGDAVGSALATAQRVQRREFDLLALRADHTDAGRLEHAVRGWLQTHPGEIGPGIYTARGATWEVAVDHAVIGDLTALLATFGVSHEAEHLGTDIRAVRL
jgi:uncharacterized YigZ family protein